MEMRHSKSHESEDWMKMHQMRSEAMRRSVALHARLLDPHSSLKEVHNEKLLQHRSALGQLRPLPPEFRSLCMSHHNRRKCSAAAASNCNLLSHVKGRGPTQNERIQEGIKGYEVESW